MVQVSPLHSFESQLTKYIVNFKDFYLKNQLIQQMNLSRNLSQK